MLKVNALRVEQRPDVPIYVFGVNGRLIHEFAAVDAAERSSAGVLVGYQRERVARHIAEIRRYLAEPAALLPNAIVLAFNGQVRFKAQAGAIRAEWGTPGQLEIPLPGRGEGKPGFIVDGQQRVSALADLDPSRQFPVVVVALASTSADLNREQFVLVNKTKPLPRDLLNELLPHVDSALPRTWEHRRIAAQVLEILRFQRNSPFQGRVRGLGDQGPGANISQRSVLAVIETSMRRGVLARYYTLDPPDVDAMANTVRVFFEGVSRAWPYAWNGSPWTSRLVHGVGIAAVGSLMDLVMNEVDADAPRAVNSVRHRLSPLEKRCAWTDGRWPTLDRNWDELQNTSQDKRLLADYLSREYLGASMR